ncbi:MULTISPECIES: DUF58 domain-containing protein [unclassified Sinorhizobium]|uniref:DUF58 domain-containing protein n=1 Tax=unclassified Sinorhizobium TaxID=2613772 RepID=UPI0024C319F5|nr:MULTISPECIES: DUF58 domain-containing protein [unclassified Sinorhizobium]MDK1377893.1 DUF58 domain-containing protein [Sinorhizobium sp. 6-70]MDK1481436.1 DUF58 domain-containing protein [Sinorhizobium sp. 6-117]
MGISIPAFARSKGITRTRSEAGSGVYTSVEELIGLEATACDLAFLRKAPVRRLLAGRHESRMRGRGLSFEELRDYLPGDDIRTIDWRVTARTGRPAVRVYDEEKDRPALIVVDQRMNMFFGSRRAMKSVAAAQTAALCAWRVMALGDRVGGFVFGDEAVDEIRPHRSREAVIRFANAIARHNTSLHAASETARGADQLDLVLSTVAAIAKHDHLLIVISDFDGYGLDTRETLLNLSMHNDVVVILIYDPFLLELPRKGDLVVSGGALQAELQLGRGNVREAIDSFARKRGRALRAWQQEMGLPMLPLSAAEDVAPQLRRLLGQLGWRQRRR